MNQDSNKHKWTEGEWFVGMPDRHGQPIVRNEHIEIATLWHHSVGSIEKQAHANANLIAAAPELYEALDYLFDVVWVSRKKGAIEYAVMLARDALAKARGEQ